MSFGLDAELAKKAQEKYNPEYEMEVMNWITQVTGHEMTHFQSIKDGVVLCKLANKIVPNSTPRANYKPKHYLEEHGNINMFLEVAVKIGVPASDLFSLKDVGDARPDWAQVLQCLAAVSRQAQAMGLGLPRLGPTYYKSVEDQKRIEEKKNEERQKAALARAEEDRRGNERREELEQSKELRRTQKVTVAKALISSRGVEKQSFGDALRKHESFLNMNDLDKLEDSNILFGMDLETRLKRDADYAENWTEQETEVVLDWIQEVLMEECDHIFLHLKSGRKLCKLMNVLMPGSVKKINKQKISFMERENIQSFCTAARAYGLPAEDIFSVDALYDAKDLIAVMRTLLALKRKAPSSAALNARLATGSHVPVAKPAAKKTAKVKRDSDEEGSGDGESANGTEANATSEKQPPIAIFADAPPTATSRAWSFVRVLAPVVVGVGGGLGAAFGAGMALPVAVGVGVAGAIVYGGVRYAMGY